MTPQSPDAPERAPVSHSDAWVERAMELADDYAFFRGTPQSTRDALRAHLQRPRQAAVQAEVKAWQSRTYSEQREVRWSDWLTVPKSMEKMVREMAEESPDICEVRPLYTPPPAPSTEAMRGWLEAMELLIEDAEAGPHTVIGDDVLPHITTAIASLKAAIGEVE